MFRLISLWVIVLLMLSPGDGKEIAYIFGEKYEHPAGSANITNFVGSDMVNFTIAGYSGKANGSYASMTAESIRDEFDKRVNVHNQTIRDTSLKLVRDNPGDRTLDQICAIYDFLGRNWTFVGDIRGKDIFQYSNKTLDLVKGTKYSGQGDCDDFAILLAALIESIGGTSRIMLGYGPFDAHCYAEVYLGKRGADGKIDRMIKWLKAKYNAKEIYTHFDLENGNVWLNLDGLMDRSPGGRFFGAAKHIPIHIRSNTSLVPLNFANEPPKVQFSITPAKPNAGDEVTFDASLSHDVDGNIVEYLWDFGDGCVISSNDKITHSYPGGGEYLVNLIVKDNDNSTGKLSQPIRVNKPPVVAINYSPKDPGIKESIHFDGSRSYDPDGSIIEYKWTFDDDARRGVSLDYAYLRSGTYYANLKITDDDGATNSTNASLMVNRTWLATACDDGASRIWDTKTGTMIHKLNHNGSVNSLAFSPDGSKLATASNVFNSNDFASRIWDAENGTVLHELNHGDNVGVIAFSHDGTKLATACMYKMHINDSAAKMVKIWDAETGILLHELDHDGIAIDVAFSPDDTLLATACDFGNIIIWDAKRWIQLHKMNHGTSAKSIAFSPDSDLLAATGGRYETYIWNARTGLKIQELDHNDDYPRYVTFSPDGTKMATATGKGARTWDVRTGLELHKMNHDGSVEHITFSPNGNLLATSSRDNTARIWDVKTGSLLHTLRHDDNVLNAAFSPTGSLLATASEDSTARIWDAKTGKELHKLIHNGYGSVRKVAFCPKEYMGL